ncbi:hypothetical protein BCR39DRAFT_585918 [Naematelia encephala]|uniref:Uncharacterized protein n=1 Tax=Naematelia encephala TaxID=71784 RepID=A0A1Y2BJQ0_9TREE|nr:hypothetical protein BCR39DRAFT_585918 [Naematelia encephala]
MKSPHNNSSLQTILDGSILPSLTKLTLSMSPSAIIWNSSRTTIALLCQIANSTRWRSKSLDVKLEGHSLALASTVNPTVQLPNCFTHTSDEQTRKNQPSICLTLHSHPRETLEDTVEETLKETLTLYRSDDFDRKLQAFRTYWASHDQDVEYFAESVKRFNDSMN